MKLPAFFTRHSSLFLVLMAILATPVAHAATLTADPTAVDEATDSDGLCSLREAVLSVNAGIDQGGCSADVTEAYGTNDTINLPAGTYNLTVTGFDEGWAPSAGADPYVVTNSPDASVGDLDIVKSVKIVGAGVDTTTVQWDASVADVDRDRIFHVFTMATVTVDVLFKDFTVTGGRTTQEFIAYGPDDPTSLPVVDTEWYLRRAGAGIAVGAAANVVQIDPGLTGTENSAGRGGSLKPSESEPGGATISAVLTNVKVTGNLAQGDGGGLYIAAPTSATYLVVDTNKSSTNGGGIYNEANTSVSTSTISGNIAEGGGGLFTTGSNIVKIKRSTFTLNRAVGGGAISNRSGVTVELENSTLSGNIARDVGAGLYTNGSAFLDFVTVADNLSGADAPTSGSGINTFPAGGNVTMTLKNVLLSGNKKGLPYIEGDLTTDPTSDSYIMPDAATIALLPPSNCGTTAGGGGITVYSLGHNLSGDVTCYSAATVMWFGDTSDINNMDPMIGPLTNNGGPTLTHALLDGSPALGAGVASAGVTVDQRGVARDNPPDIGAYESPAPTSTGGGGSSGGCAYDPNGSSDWTLLILLLTGMGGLLIRHRRNNTSQQ